MPSPQTPDEPGALQNAQATISAQAAEIERLQKRLEEEHFAQDLRRALTQAAAAGTIAAPATHSQLLEMIVRAAVQVIAADAAALFLIDEPAQEMVCEVVLGGSGTDLKKVRLPLGKGIAGLVAVTGQPMAVSDAEQDARVAAQLTDAAYQPRSILCVPMFSNDRTTGVLGLYDKRGAADFSPADIETLGLFANLAAVALEQSRTQSDLSALIASVLKSGLPHERQADFQERAGAFANSIEEEISYVAALDMAEMVRAIAQAGEHEARAARAVLQGFADYLAARSRPLSTFGISSGTSSGASGGGTSSAEMGGGL